MPDNLDQVLESTQSERLATDFVFTEGPCGTPTAIGCSWTSAEV